MVHRSSPPAPPPAAATGPARTKPAGPEPVGAEPVGADPQGALRRAVLEDAAVLLGLWGLAVAHPLLDLFGRNAAYFVVARMQGAEVVAFALVVCFGPPGFLIAVQSAVLAASRRAGRIVHLVFVGVLGSALGASLARHLFSGSDLGTVAFAVVVATLAIVGILRWRSVALGLRYLAVTPALFLALFLFWSGASDLVVEGEATAAEGEAAFAVGNPAPVVFLQLDELPVASLMAADGSVNEAMFPNFARLAAGATWYRNATAVSDGTVLSVPSILTGELPEPSALPTRSDHPRNLFTLLGARYEMNVREPVTDLCPPDVCQSSDADGDGQALLTSLQDAVAVYGHLTLPPAAREHLPAVDRSWGRFLDGGGETTLAPAASVSGARTEPGSAAGSVATADAVSAPAPEPSALDLPAPGLEGAAAERWIEQVDGGVGTLSYAHLVLPHNPWVLTKDGRQLEDPGPSAYTPSARWSSDPLVVREGLRDHLRQTQYVDLLLGRLIDRLEGRGTWDDALVVVVADHGVAFEPGMDRRAPSDATVHEIFNVPLFVKYPHQRAGSIDDGNVLTIDVLATLIEVLEIDTDWSLDGRSLLAAGEARAVKPVIARGVHEVPLGLDGVFTAVARNHTWLPRLDDPAGRAVAVGPYAQLVGQPVTALPMASGGAPEVWTYQPVEDYRADDPEVPVIQVGFVVGWPQGPPDGVVLALNGTVAGVSDHISCDIESCQFRARLRQDLLRDRDNQLDVLVPSADQPGSFTVATVVPPADD